MTNKGYEAVSKKPRNNGCFAPKGKVAMKTVGLRLPIEIVNWLEAEAKRKGVTKTDIARELIEKQIPA